MVETSSLSSLYENFKLLLGHYTSFPTREDLSPKELRKRFELEQGISREVNSPDSGCKIITVPDEIELKNQEFGVNLFDLDTIVATYALSNFPMAYSNMNGAEIYSRSVFDVMPKVSKFIQDIKKYRGELYLNKIAGHVERGVISGPPVLSFNKARWNLLVPVFMKQQKSDKSGWIDLPNESEVGALRLLTGYSPDRRFFDTSFDSRTEFNGRVLWTGENEPDSIFYGGTGPEKSVLYLGNESVLRASD